MDEEMKWFKGKIPDKGSLLVFLDEEVQGSQYAILHNMITANGVIKHLTGIDLKDLDCNILAWAYLPEYNENLGGDPNKGEEQ